MARLTARLLAGSTALVVLASCAQQQSPPLQETSSPSVPPSVSSSVPIGSTSQTITSPAAAAPCDLVAHGEDGIPTEQDAPLLVVRFGSYWGYSMQYAPVLVIYRSGAVAAAQTPRSAGSATGSMHSASGPFRPYLGGKFSRCAVDRLMAEYDEFTRTDLGTAASVDCTRATIQRFAPEKRRVVSRIVVDGFGCEGEVNYGAADKQRVERAARDRLVAWFARARSIAGGRELPMTPVFLVADGHGYPVASNKKVIPWTAEHLDPHQGCKRLTGPAASRAVTLVATSLRAEPARGDLPFVYTARWLVAGNQQKFDVMVAPPAMKCDLSG